LSAPYCREISSETTEEPHSPLPLLYSDKWLGKFDNEVEFPMRLVRRISHSAGTSDALYGVTFSEFLFQFPNELSME
jgi:hypothetical protein